VEQHLPAAYAPLHRSELPHAATDVGADSYGNASLHRRPELPNPVSLRCYSQLHTNANSNSALRSGYDGVHANANAAV